MRRRAICRTCTPVLSQKSISRADESESPAVVWKCLESPPKSICITGTVWPRHTAWRRYWYLTPPPLVDFDDMPRWSPPTSAPKPTPFFFFFLFALLPRSRELPYSSSILYRYTLQSWLATHR